MKTPEQWITENSQSGPFDTIDNSKDARALVAEIQRDAITARTCDGCRHWTEVSGPTEPEPLGTCRKSAINHWHADYAYDPSKAWVADDDNNWGLGTGPKFGCVHWEVKQPPVA